MPTSGAERRFVTLARKLRRARHFSVREALDVARAFGWIALIRVGVHVLPYPTLLRYLDRGLPAPVAGWQEDARMPVLRLAKAVDIAERNTWPRPKCLARSLALMRMLRAIGIPAEVKIGVARPGGGFEAHAWVELEGLVVNDAPDISSRFRPLEQAAELARLKLSDVAEHFDARRLANLETQS